MQISYFLIIIYMEEFHEEESHHPELSLYIFVFLSVHGTMFSNGWESLKQTWAKLSHGARRPVFADFGS